MVSRDLKLRYSLEKSDRARKVILPLFARESIGDFTEEILREDEDIREIVLKNPFYKAVLENRVKDAFSRYQGVMYGAKVVDSWDRVTSAFGLAADAAGPFSGGIGHVLSAVEELAELIPKGIYSVYYLGKTGDMKALPIWAGAEAASFIPVVGDAIDMTNIYVNRARGLVKKKAIEDFRRFLKSGLEQRVKMVA